MVNQSCISFTKFSKINHFWLNCDLRHFILSLPIICRFPDYLFEVQTPAKTKEVTFVNVPFSFMEGGHHGQFLTGLGDVSKRY